MSPGRLSASRPRARGRWRMHDLLTGSITARTRPSLDVWNDWAPSCLFGTWPSANAVGVAAKGRNNAPEVREAPLRVTHLSRREEDAGGSFTGMPTPCSYAKSVADFRSREHAGYMRDDPAWRKVRRCQRRR